jgi:hypothetical protein
MREKPSGKVEASLRDELNSKTSERWIRSGGILRMRE